MAKIHEEVLIIKVSRLIKDDQDLAHGSLISAETAQALEQVAQELVGAGTVVEIEQA